MKSSSEQLAELRHGLIDLGFAVVRKATDGELEAAIAKFTEEFGRFPDRQALADRAMREAFFEALWPRPKGVPF